MARKTNRSSQAADGVQIPGLRAHERAREVKNLSDPRVTFLDDLSSQQRAAMNAAWPVVQAAQKAIEQIDAGEDIMIPSWCVGGNHFPEARELLPWLPDYASIIVDANDSVRPGQSKADAGWP